MSSVEKMLRSLSAFDSSKSELDATDLQPDCDFVEEVSAVASSVDIDSGQKRVPCVSSSWVLNYIRAVKKKIIVRLV